MRTAPLKDLEEMQSLNASIVFRIYLPRRMISLLSNVTLSGLQSNDVTLQYPSAVLFSEAILQKLFNRKLRNDINCIVIEKHYHHLH